MFAEQRNARVSLKYVCLCIYTCPSAFRLERQRRILSYTVHG